MFRSNADDNVIQGGSEQISRSERGLRCFWAVFPHHAQNGIAAREALGDDR